MLMNFGSLTLEIRTGPLTNVCIDAWPHVTGGGPQLLARLSWPKHPAISC